MASTRLIRKTQRKRAKQERSADNIKRLNFKPVIKKVDVEELKKSFA